MDDRDNLEASVRELTATLEELRSELRDPPARTGPLGLPRPPSPGELLRFTEQYTIPALISLLEANVRLLELLAAALRVADGRPIEATEELADAGGRLEAVRAGGREGVAAASRATLRRLDDALAELQTAAEGGTPDDPEVRRLLSRARELRSEVDERLAKAEAEAESASADGTTGAVEVDVDGPDGSDDDETDEQASDDVAVDVDEELETIRRQVDGPDDDEPDDDG
ncbi:hypothetical protein BRC88_00835 [Halobacteriales archaeon QS_4_69_225]|nr:MAG: hypothetical protein BRC88_00835 [Halobacteriales archaeon QS_4_69_225]